MKQIVLSGIQPTSQLTLGNYLGALRNWVPMQAQYECIFLVVDLHSLTVPQDPAKLSEQIYQTLAIYLAAGIDPSLSTICLQSQIPEHTQLGWILTCASSMGELSRMTQFKEKSSKQGEHIPTGIFVYPALMAADILLYQTDFVPVGADQKQHLELARDLAERVNNRLGDPLFKIPNPMIPPTGAKIMSLQDPTKKMSKSDPDPLATLFLLESDAEITKKLKRAVTDSGSEIRDSEEQPGIRNLLEILSALSGGKSRQAIAQDFAGKQYGHLKIATAEAVVAAIGPLRTETQRYLADRGELDRIFAAGREKARERAQQTLKKVYSALGLPLSSGAL